MARFKVCLLGDSAVGKSCLVEVLSAKDFRKTFIHNTDIEVTTLSFQTFNPDYKDIIDLWNIPCDVKDLRPYLLDTDAIIFMFDVTYSPSYDYMMSLIENVKQIKSGVPMVILGNKVDLCDRRVMPVKIAKELDRSLFKYWDFSVKSKYNYEKPFMYLLRLFHKDDNIGMACTNKITSYKIHNMDNDLSETRKQLKERLDHSSSNDEKLDILRNFITNLIK